MRDFSARDDAISARNMPARRASHAPSRAANLPLLPESATRAMRAATTVLRYGSRTTPVAAVKSGARALLVDRPPPRAPRCFSRTLILSAPQRRVRLRRCFSRRRQQPPRSPDTSARRRTLSRSVYRAAMIISPPADAMSPPDAAAPPSMF